MIDIDSLPFNTPLNGKNNTHFTTDMSKLNYSKPLNPIDKILISTISNHDKIAQIEKHLVDKCGILSGSFSNYLAILSLGDKLLIGRAKSKMNSRRIKKKKKKKRK